MRRVQTVAVDRFLDVGFDAATVEEIARLSDVSPVSVYRWFGSKEGVVLWDEYDPPILVEVAAHLRTVDPLTAVRRALADVLATVYDRDRRLVLARSRLIHREPALMAAALLQGRDFQVALARTLHDAGSGQEEVESDATAAAVVALLSVAVDHWQRDGGAHPLAGYIDRAFSALDTT